MSKIVNIHYKAYAIDLHLIYKVWYWRHYFGYSIDDLAFLSDIDARLLRSIEDPTLRIGSAKSTDETSYELPRISVGEYDLDQIDFIRAVFDTVSLEELIPKNFFDDDLINVQASCEISPGSRHLRINKVGHDGTLVMLYDFNKTNLRTNPLRFSFSREKHIALIDQLINSGYFDEPRLAIEIYRQLVSLFQVTPKPITLEKAIRYYTGRKKGIRLSKRTLRDGHALYLKKS